MVTMTSEVDATETTIALASKSILKSIQQPTKTLEVIENVATTATTTTLAAATTASDNNHINTITNNNNTNKQTINDQITATTTTATPNTNGIGSVIECMKRERVEKADDEGKLTALTNGKECIEVFDNSSNKENITIVNNIVTVEICCNTTVTETTTTTKATTTTEVNTAVATIPNLTITNVIPIDNAISNTTNANANANTTITTNATTTATTCMNNSITLIDSNISTASISSTDNGNRSSSICHQKPISHRALTAITTTTTTSSASTFQQHSKNENAPNILVYKKMEAIIEKMQAEGTGVTVRTVKGFITKVPSVFTGADLIAWILKNLDIDDVTEALHFAHLLSSHGYIFPIDDHALTVKNDGTFYRFQTPYFWPSNCWEPENTDYAVYLCKRTMQNKTRLELADYEAENLAKLQKMFSRKWEFIFMQAESQSKVAKKRDKLERKVLDSQERAFWDVHRPMPGCVNTTEIDIKKAYRRGDCSHGTGSAGAAVTKNPIELLTRIIALRKQKLERRTIKISKAAEALVSYYEQYHEFDYFITAGDLPNPWQTDSTEMWDAEKNSKEVPLRNVKRWAFNMRELLKDPVGREQFAKFLEKEYSVENILFWEAVQEMKALPQSSITKSIQKIWQEFLAPDAPYAVNIDSKSIDLARDAVNSTNPNRWCFDVAAAHIYHLMERDSYPRYLRSDMYKDFLNCSRKKVKSIPNLFGVKR